MVYLITEKAVSTLERPISDAIRTPEKIGGRKIAAAARIRWRSKVIRYERASTFDIFRFNWARQASSCNPLLLSRRST